MGKCMVLKSSRDRESSRIPLGGRIVTYHNSVRDNKNKLFVRGDVATSITLVVEVHL